MYNPYQILNVSQDATKSEIHFAQKRAMANLKNSGYSLTDIQSAARQLLDPAKRLAADFMFPSKIKAKRPQKIKVEVVLQEVDIYSVNANALNSLK